MDFEGVAEVAQKACADASINGSGQSLAGANSSYGRVAWFAQNVQPNVDELRRWLRRSCGLADDVLDDVLQDIFVRLLQTRSVDHIQCARSYMRRTAWSVILTRNRRPKWLKIVPVTEEEYARAPCPAPLPDEIVCDRLALQRFQRALNRLPPRTRTMVMLHKIEEMPVADVANQLALSESSVRKSCKEAMIGLKEMYRERL